MIIIEQLRITLCLTLYNALTVDLPELEILEENRLAYFYLFIKKNVQITNYA